MTDQLIHAKLAEARRDLPAVGKDSRNEKQGFNYRGIDAVIDAVGPILARHGINPEVRYELVTLVADHTTKNNDVWYRAVVDCEVRLIAEDGSYITHRAVGMGLDNMDKAVNKAMSGAYKYAITHGLMLPGSTSDDVDGAPADPRQAAPAPEMATRTQQEHLIAWQGVLRTDHPLTSEIKREWKKIGTSIPSRLTRAEADEVIAMLHGYRKAFDVPADVEVTLPVSFYASGQEPF